MSPWRRKKNTEGRGLADAQAACEAATRNLEATRSRWSVVHKLSGQAQQIGSQVQKQNETNHFGEVISKALREG